MTLSLGQLLRTTREERGISLEEISRTTRIKREYLQALENNQPELLPSRVQGRGFLRLYADYLHLPEQVLLDAWDGQPIEFPIKSETPLETDHSIENLSDSPENDQDQKDEEPLTIEITSSSDPASLKDNQEEDYRESTQVFISIGETLRNTRELLGISVADVEHFTKLREFYLSALESGAIDQLPSPVQGRGMLSNYASFLNLDVETILLQFAEGLQKRRIEKNKPETSPEAISATKGKTRAKAPQLQPAWKRLLTSDLLIGVGFISALLIFIIWGAARVGKMRQTELQPTTASISEVLVAGEPTDMTTGTMTATLLESPPAVVSEATLQPGSSSPTSVIPENSSQSNAPIQVTIIANQRAWMQIVVDNSVKFNGRVLPGNAYAYSGRSEVKIETGNGAALQVIFNDTDLGLLGVMGEIIRLTFTPDGIEFPTPISTPTFTPTTLPTATLRPTATQVPPTITPYLP